VVGPYKGLSCRDGILLCLMTLSLFYVLYKVEEQLLFSVDRQRASFGTTTPLFAYRMSQNKVDVVAECKERLKVLSRLFDTGIDLGMFLPLCQHGLAGMKRYVSAQAANHGCHVGSLRLLFV
jgi:hypothetical protein